MFLQEVVGPQNLTDGAQPFTRAGKQADTIVSELHGRYYEQTYRQNVFSSASQAGVTTSAGLATTYTGLCLSNDNGSTKNLVLNKVSWAQTIIQTTVLQLSLATGFLATANVTHTTPSTTLKSNYLGGAAPTAKVDTAATLSIAPTYHLFLEGAQTATSNFQGGAVDLEGSLIIPPGGFVCFTTNAASPAAAMWFGFQWEEVLI